MKKGLLLAVLFVLAGSLRLNGLWSRPLWTDEFYTFFQATGHGKELEALLKAPLHRHTPPFLRAKAFKSFLRNDPAKGIKEVTAGILETDTHPPFYFWVMHYWLKAFGSSAASARLFSFCCAMLALMLFYQAAKMLFDKEAGYFSFLFAGASAFAVRYAQEARSYSLVLLLILLSAVFLLRFERNGSWKALIGFAATACLGVCAHYFYAFLMVAYFIYFTFAHAADTRMLRAFYAGFLCSLLGVSFWTWPLIARGYDFSKVEWIFGYPGAFTKLLDFFYGLGRYLFISDGAFPGRLLFICLLLASAWVVVFSLKPFLARLQSRAGFLCLLMFLVPLVSMLLIDLLQKGALLRQERFWMFAFPGFVLIVGMMLSLPFRQRGCAIGALFLLMSFSSLGVGRVDFGPVPQEACAWIKEKSGSAETAVFIYNIRSAVISQASCLADEVFLVPVKDPEQLTNAFSEAGKRGIERVFVSCFYHRTGSELMNQRFVEQAEDYAGRFLLKEEFKTKDIRVQEYEDTHRPL